MSRWLRINEDCIDNPKILKLPEALRWQWVALLCVASKNDGVLPPIDDVALCLRVPEAKAAEFITKLVKARLIDKDGDHFVPHNWTKRQFKSDSSTDRVKRFRNKKRNVSDSVSETVTETAPEAETEPDTEQSTADGRALDEIGLKNEKALSAVFTALCLNLNRSPPDLRPIRAWLLDGIAMGTISTAVTPILKRKADMISLIYCDTAVRQAHAAVGGLQIVSSKVWVDEGTEEWNSHQTISFEKTGRGTPICDHKDENGRITGRRGWYFATLWAEGFNDFGERIGPADQEENAA